MTSALKLINIINKDALAMINNPIVQNMSVINWGKTMARCNEIIQQNLLYYYGYDVYDAESIKNHHPFIMTNNNCSGFDMVVKKFDGRVIRIQSKLRQVRGETNFSRQVHFETTRRHSKKNENDSSNTGHVAYSKDEFDYVMITLINIGKNGELLSNRNDVNKWSFSIIPVIELVNQNGHCDTKISSNLLKKYEYKYDKDLLTNLF